MTRWVERSLQPATYWDGRWSDVVHEKRDGFLSGVIVGIVAAWAFAMFVLVIA